MTDHRRQDDFTLENLRAELSVYSNRIGVIEAAVSEIDRRLYDHMQHEDESLIHLHECIHAQTKTIAMEIKAVRDSVDVLRNNLFPLTLKDAGEGLWGIGEWLQKAARWLLPMLSFFLIAGSIVLWMMGKIPFPK